MCGSHPDIGSRSATATGLRIGTVLLVFSHLEQHADPDSTQAVEPEPESDAAALSPFQFQVVRCLCESWLAGGSLDRMPSNDDVAARLGTPRAGAAVKAALRRVYAKAGLSELPANTKRRQICPIARRHGWL